MKRTIIGLVAFLAVACGAPPAAFPDANLDCIDDNTGVHMCPINSFCTNSGACECMQGAVEVAGLCQTHGYAARYVLNIPVFNEDADFSGSGSGSGIPIGSGSSIPLRRAGPTAWTRADILGRNFFGVALCPSINEWGFFLDWNDQAPSEDVQNYGWYTAIYCIYASEADAQQAALAIRADPFLPDAILDGPAVFAFTLPTTENPLYIPPTGLEVDSVHFKTDCEESGCWVIKGVLTTGANLWDNNAFNTFYIPMATGNDTLSFDFDYSAVEWTFQPVNHPCTSVNYDASQGLTQEVSTCCIHASDGFLANYRPTTAFVSWADLSVQECGSIADAQVIDRPGVVLDGDIYFPYFGNQFLQGTFMGLSNCRVKELNVTDPFFGKYEFEINLDEVELRRNAGKLVGTVGVEHTIDTFLGITNFRTTGIQALDTFSTQIAIHLEKTSFFTVSTEGTNQYTFLEYVNLRLIAVYREDVDFSDGADSAGAADRTVRTDANGQINYVQVTFTLGSQYSVDEDPAAFPLIPLDSVRAGHGTFFDAAADLTHKCMEYPSLATGWDDAMLTSQDCAPNAAMCVSPTSIDDSFVSFNIPLGTDYFDLVAGGASSTLSNNIFVDMVISAVEATAGNPNQGDDPQQMKTTLTASIPIVEGGINIFCDGFTAKTDLKDVANADIVVGSASTADELTRLRIMEDVASTSLAENPITQIDSDSIEAGLMTLVLKGNESYFAGTNTGRAEVTIELEDVITIHIMQDDGTGGGTTGKSLAVDNLLAMAPQDNSLGGDLDTDGYPLNGAFSFTIDRAAQRAHLEPSAALLTECPFNPPRPDPTAVLLETCVTRRDVRYRGFPARTGALSTAVEICTLGDGACPAQDAMNSVEARFFQTIFGDNEYAKKLGSNYANVIANHYSLNGRYRRAYFINPGYEWTPTQTGGAPIFQVSQKLYLFALITLDEGIAGVAPGMDGADVSLPSARRRRMLLQSTPSSTDEALQDGQSSVGGGVFEFQTSPSQMMAKAFNVPQDRVATFNVRLQLTQAEACMSHSELQSSIRATLEDYLTGSASPFHTVQITKVSVDTAGVQCARRSIRSLLGSFTDATAEVTMLVVFEDGQDSGISLAKLRGMAGVESVEPLSVSPAIDTAVDGTGWTSVPGSTQDDNDDSSSSTSLGLVAGAAAGGAVVLIGAIAGFMYMRKKKSRRECEVVDAIPAINIMDLKQELATEV